VESNKVHLEEPEFGFYRQNIYFCVSFL